jgi:antitoxin VapB
MYIHGGLFVKAKVFKSGNSQAVRLPKEFRLTTHEVEIFRRNDEIVLKAVPGDLAQFFQFLTNLSDDFMGGGRKQPELQKRRNL